MLPLWTVLMWLVSDVVSANTELHWKQWNLMPSCLERLCHLSPLRSAYFKLHSFQNSNVLQSGRMNTLCVWFHFSNGFEHLFTLTAMERLLSCMFTNMYLQMSWNRKSLFTHCKNMFLCGSWFVFKIFYVENSWFSQKLWQCIGGSAKGRTKDSEDLLQRGYIV